MRHLTFILALAAAAAATPASSEDLIIGYSMAKTGTYVSLANTNEIAVNMAIDEINAKGGVNGQKLKVVTFDTGGDPKQATLAVRKFAEDDKALAVIGPFSSSEVRVAFPAGERLGIVQMSMASSAPGLSAPFKFGFRNTTDEGRVLTEVIASLKDKKVPVSSGAIAYATDDIVSKSMGTAVLPKLFEANNIPVKGSVDFQYNAFDLSSQVSQLAQMKPDIIGLGTPPEAAINLAKEMRRQGVTGRLIGGTTIATPDLVPRMEGAGEGMTIGTTFSDELNAATKAFTAEFGKRAKAAKLQRVEPNQFDAAVYDIVYLFAEAMKRAKTTGAAAKVEAERGAIREELSKIRDFDAIEGRISFDDNRDAIKPVYVVEARGGVWKLFDVRIPK